MPWRSGLHNMGMSFTRTEWNKIRECSERFCKVRKRFRIPHVTLVKYVAVWWLQLGLVPPARVPQLHAGETAGDAGKGSQGFPYWRMVRLSWFSICWLILIILSSGVHHKKSNCDSKAVSEKVKKIIKSAKTYFFPKRWTTNNSYLVLKTTYNFNCIVNYISEYQCPNPDKKRSRS